MGTELAAQIAPIDARTHSVAPRRTPATPGDLRAAIATAYHRLTGKSASASLLDTLTAQASLETGRGAQMYNFNFGGIKGCGPQGNTANCMTHEVIASHDVTIRQGFRAYGTLEEGAEDYVRLLSHRFGAAFSKAQVGDVDGFAHALKQAGYYTAAETDYATALRSLTGAKQMTAIAPAPTLSEAMSPASNATYSDSAELSRVLNALSSSALTVARPAHEDE
jgi:flagellar protein FlgJ